jgi:hypothetical protein
LLSVLDRRALGGLVCVIIRATLRSAALVYIWFTRNMRNHAVAVRSGCCGLLI